MKLNKILHIVVLTITACTTFSCINVNYELGKNLQATNQQYDIYETSINLDKTDMAIPEGLATYSTLKFAVGAIKIGNKIDSRSACFSLVPNTDTLDFGKSGTQVFKRFHFRAPLEYTSYNNNDQKYILQTIKVYALNKAIDPEVAEPQVDADFSKMISNSNIIYNGMDSLSFDFTKEFAEKFFTMTADDLKSIKNYTKKFPGIYIKSNDTPETMNEGGRINVFKLPVDVQSNVITGGYATLSFSAEYEGRGRVDTSFTFIFGPAKVYKLLGQRHTNETLNPQYSYNYCKFTDNTPTDGNLYLEGGNGYKPVFRGNILYEKIAEKIKSIAPNADLSKVLINKATLDIPFIFPENYQEMYKYPLVISPYRKRTKNDTIIYVPITDANITSLSKGSINRSKLLYSPDISYYTQILLKNKKDSDFSEYDLWLLPMRNELVSVAKTKSAEELQQEEEYKEILKRNIAYSAYNDYPGSYGYGGYGYGYGGYYNQNYYNLAMLEQFEYEQNKPQERINILMPDYITYYDALLVSKDIHRYAKLKLVFSIPKK